MKALKSVQLIDTDAIQTSWIADIDSNALLMSDGYIADESFVVASRPWYKCTEVGHTVLTEPYEDVNTGQLVVTVSTPVYSSIGKLIGVAGMDILLDKIISTVSQYKIGESGFVTLLSSEGMFIYHPNSENIGTYIADMNVSKELVYAVLIFRWN